MAVKDKALLQPRLRWQGSNLAIIAVVSVMLVGFMGVSIYMGLQAYVTSELQKAATTAAMVGASHYYSDRAANGRPLPNAARAEQIAENTFKDIVEGSKALKGFNATLKSKSSNDDNDSVTLEVNGTMPVAFLAPVGIRDIEVTAKGTARALKYVPTDYVGPISMMPNGTMQNAQRTVVLAFPLIDNAGSDLYVEQAAQSAYAVEACNDAECYDLVAGAHPVGSGRIITYRGEKLIIGSAFIDLAEAKVNKATRLRFTHGNRFDVYYGGQGQTIPLYPTPVTIRRVDIFGYSGLCPAQDKCPIPVGFAPME